MFHRSTHLPLKQSFSILRTAPLLSILLLFVLSCPILSAQQFTDFTWQHPKYAAHSLNEVKHVAGQTFIAVGDEGMLLMSYDNGQTWTLKQRQTLKQLRAIWVFDANNILVAGSYNNSGLEMYRTSDGGNTWALTYSNNAIGVNDLQFPTPQTGYLVGNLGAVLRSDDGGTTWNNISNSSINGSLQSVWFTSPEVGFAGRTSTFGMYKTTDGGQTWSQNFSYYFTNCYSIRFLSNTFGFAGANGNAIFRTTDAGQTWSLVSNPGLSEYIRCFDFADSLQGIALAGGYIYRTTNGGITWSSTFYTGNLRSGALSPDGHAVVGNLTGGIRISSNYAATFADANPEAGNQTFRRIRFYNNTANGWVGGDGGKVLKTINYGTTWQLQTAAPYVDYINDMALLSASRVLLCSSDGKIVSTTNGGNSFTTQTLDATGPLNAIHFPTATTGYVCGNTGKLWKSTNGGNTFSPINISGVTQNLTELHFPSASVGYVLDEFSQLRKTINGGTSFTVLNNVTVGSAKQLWFLNDTTGYVLSNNGAVYRTTNGSTFTPAGNTCLQTVFDLYCLNDSTCFAVGSFTNASCDVSFTSNRGESWTNLTFPYAYAGCGVHAIDTATIWLVGQNQTIIRRGTGGILTQDGEAMTPFRGGIQLIPNPATESVMLSASSPIDRWQLFDISGRLCLEGTEKIVDVRLLKAGLYCLRAVCKDGDVHQSKLIRQ